MLHIQTTLASAVDHLEDKRMYHQKRRLLIISRLATPDSDVISSFYKDQHESLQESIAYETAAHCTAAWIVRAVLANKYTFAEIQSLVMGKITSKIRGEDTFAKSGISGYEAKAWADCYDMIFNAKRISDDDVKDYLLNKDNAFSKWLES